jgi:hypothetical protein
MGIVGVYMLVSSQVLDKEILERMMMFDSYYQFSSICMYLMLQVCLVKKLKLILLYSRR